MTNEDGSSSDSRERPAFYLTTSQSPSYTEQMKYLAIDLEIEQPRSNPQTLDSMTDTPELIQAGIVVFELAAGEPTVLFSKTYMVNYPYELSNFIKALTSISDEDVNKATLQAKDILDIIRALMQEYGTSRQIVEWGSGDTKFIAEKAGLDTEQLGDLYGIARSQINVKTLFQCYALANDIKTKGGLSKSMGKLGMGFKSTHYKGRNRGCHWAESDALNTARIFNKLISLMRRTDGTN